MEVVTGFTGTRDGLTAAQRHTLGEALRMTTEFHHGDCIGADEEADALARMHGARVVIHPPIIEDLRAYCGNPHDDRDRTTWVPAKDYLARNRDIVHAADRLIACPRETTRTLRGGTWYTVRFAESVGKPVRIIWPDGTAS